MNGYKVEKLNGRVIDEEGKIHESTKTIERPAKAYTFSNPAWAITINGYVVMAFRKGFHVYETKRAATEVMEALTGARVTIMAS